jgi:DHA1 family bicyclomycin/chloramphenicol resistance-like MFS transporter
MMTRQASAIHPIPAHAPVLYLASLPSLATVFGVPASTMQLSMFVAGFGGAQLVIGPLLLGATHPEVVS